jgi:hypothetical protein
MIIGDARLSFNPLPRLYTQSPSLKDKMTSILPPFPRFVMTVFEPLSLFVSLSTPIHCLKFQQQEKKSDTTLALRAQLHHSYPLSTSSLNRFLGVRRRFSLQTLRWWHTSKLLTLSQKPIHFKAKYWRYLSFDSDNITTFVQAWEHLLAFVYGWCCCSLHNHRGQSSQKLCRCSLAGGFRPCSDNMLYHAI